VTRWVVSIAEISTLNHFAPLRCFDLTLFFFNLSAITLSSCNLEVAVEEKWHKIETLYLAAYPLKLAEK